MKTTSNIVKTRINKNDGDYSVISNKILFNNNLTDASVRLLQLILNNNDDWYLVFEYYKKELNWSKRKLASTIDNLIKNGYLKRTKTSFGNNGFSYKYQISELGNLNDIPTVDSKRAINKEKKIKDIIPTPVKKESILPKKINKRDPINLTDLENINFDKVFELIDQEKIIINK